VFWEQHSVGFFGNQDPMTRLVRVFALTDDAPKKYSAHGTGSCSSLAFDCRPFPTGPEWKILLIIKRRFELVNFPTA
jgi:hypothetical protein